MYDWPGNIRELKDAHTVCLDHVRRSVHPARSPAHVPDPAEPPERRSIEDPRDAAREPLERLMIEHALKTSTTRSEVASQLGMSVETLSSKLLEYELNLDPRIPLVDKGKGPQ